MHLVLLYKLILNLFMFSLNLQKKENTLKTTTHKIRNDKNLRDFMQTNLKQQKLENKNELKMKCEEKNYQYKTESIILLFECKYIV